ncbi:MAG: sulfotransferase family 2 domain-containing protein [Nitrospinae bacterium]|nr:sulfotransferase family 2 domain-containing protein [Nitrospinota bacterium]
MFIFLHIQKTAGTTLRYLINRNFPDSETLLVKLMTQAHWDSFLKNKPKNLSQLKLIYGHMKFGIHEHISGDCRYFTILRDPVSRVISHHRFLLSEAALPPGKKTLEEYVRWLSENNMDNHQTRVLAGSWFDNDTSAPSAPEMLERARKNLDEHFILAGIQERFTESIALLNILMGWENKSFVTRNVTSNKGISYPEKFEEESKLKSLIKKNNEYDYELYDYAKSNFEKLIEIRRAEVNKAISELNAQNSMKHRFIQRAYNLVESGSQLMKNRAPRFRKTILNVLGPKIGKIWKGPPEL